MVEFALGFILVETRSLTLNINAPASAFVSRLLAAALAAVAIWTEQGLPVALVLMVSQQATLVHDVLWLCSRRHWRGCCHVALLVCFVLVFVLVRALCCVAAAVLAWSLLLRNHMVPAVPGWAAYGLVGGLCALFVAHATWACQAAVRVCADLGSRSDVAARRRQLAAAREREWITSNNKQAEKVPILAARRRSGV